MQFLEEDKEFFIICSKEDKKKIISYISEKKKMYTIHFFTIPELKKKLFFDYSKQCIYEVSKYLHVKPSVAKVYIENLYYIEDKVYHNKKLDTLVSLKRYLDQQNLLIYDSYFFDYIKDKDFLVYNFSSLTKFEKRLIDSISIYASVSYYREETKKYHPIVYRASTLEEEVEFIANKIIDLIKKGISISKIKLVNIDNDYTCSLKRVFGFYQIPINMEEQNSLYATEIGRDFLTHYEKDIAKTITYLKNKYEDDSINKIISICNDYNFVTDYNLVKECIMDDMKEAMLSKEKYKEAVEVISIEEVEEDDFVFLMNFNLNKIPKFKKDEDFITDSIKPLVSLDLTYEENKMISSKIKEQIMSIKNLVITYKEKSISTTYYPSNLIYDLSLEVKDALYSYQYSILATKIKLAKMMDCFIKFGTKEKDMDCLYQSVCLDYATYDNQFTGIKKEDFYNFLQRDLKLSYSTLDNYNRCAFKYYISSVLKLDIYEDNFITFIGSLFHYILEKGLVKDIDIVEEVHYFIQRSERNLTLKEKFLLKKLIKELGFIIETIKEQMKHSKLKDMLFENKIEIKMDKEIPVTFKGFIDKICFKKIGDKTVVAIIDYKTGNTQVDLKNSFYGIGMQLPIYLYLASNYKKIENAVFAGFYLQRILSEEGEIQENKTQEEIKKEHLKLNGFSNKDTEILELFDNTYEDSKVIHSMGLYKNGNFKTTRVLSDEQITNLLSLTEKVIEDTTNHILDADFRINPKQIGTKEEDKIGCMYCKFKDICFVGNKDFVKLKKQENLDFLEGEE